GLFKLLNWKNISIANKYITSFSVAAILFLLSGFIVHMQLSVVEKDIAQLDSDSQLTFEMMQMSSLIQMKDMQMADYIITKNDRYVDEYEAYHEEFIELESKLEPLMHTEKQQALFEFVKENNRQMDEVLADIQEVIDGQEIMSTIFRERSNSLRVGTVDALNMLIDNIFEEHNNTIN